MSETTHHDTPLHDEGFHEIQLSGKQLVFLFMFTATVLVVTFLCGVQVGRNVKAPDRPIESADTLTSAPAVPPASATPSQPAASSGPPASEPPAPAAEPEDELSYAKRLQAETPPNEKLKPAPSAAAPAAAPASTAAARGATTPAVPPATASTAGKPDAPATKGKGAQKTAAAAPSGGRPGTWIVQLTALQDRNAAAAIVRRLSGRGYPAFVLEPGPGSPAIYRVQVGGYPDRAGAEQAARRLEKEEQFKAYVRAR